MSLKPVVRRPLAVLVEHAGLADCLSIVERPFQHDIPQTFYKRTVWVALAVGERMMLAMTRDPFLGDDRRREPQPKAHWERRKVMKLHATMRLCPMQK